MLHMHMHVGKTEYKRQSAREICLRLKTSKKQHQKENNVVICSLSAHLIWTSPYGSNALIYQR